MDISVVIPLLNEEESIQELYDWIASVMQSNHFYMKSSLLTTEVLIALGKSLKIISVKFIFKGNTLSKKLRKITGTGCRV